MIEPILMSNRMLSALRQIGPKFLARGLLLLAVLGGVGYPANVVGFEEMLKAYDFSDRPGAGWLHGRAAFVVIGGFLTAVGAPRQAVSFFAAYFYGLWAGLMVALLASGTGACIGYGFARLYSGAAQRLIRGRVGFARKIWSENTFVLSLMLRLLPVGSNFLATPAAGATAIPFLPFLTGSVLGYVPQTLVFVLLGSGVNVGSREQIALSVGLFIASAVLGVWIYANYRKRLRANGAADGSEDRIAPMDAASGAKG